MPISDRCYHLEVSPGQMCSCLDLVLWLRFLVQLQARRIDQLETDAQRGAVTYPLEGTEQ